MQPFLDLRGEVTHTIRPSEAPGNRDREKAAVRTDEVRGWDPAHTISAPHGSGVVTADGVRDMELPKKGAAIGPGIVLKIDAHEYDARSLYLR